MTTLDREWRSHAHMQNCAVAVFYVDASSFYLPVVRI
jgi:hypothetical protein